MLTYMHDGFQEDISHVWVQRFVCCNHQRKDKNNFGLHLVHYSLKNVRPIKGI